ncbi:MAG: hypothetical protein JXA92_14245 [candidate division Zixibacteria bacterium]|nr:hypothetical protein [candidate division Zixibacteria bacterium]
MKTRLLLYYGLAVGALCLWFFFVYTPMTEKHQAVKIETAEKEKKLVDFNKTLAELSNFVQTSSNLESYKVELSSRLYSKNEILKLFEQLDRDAARNQLQITEIIPPLEELLALNKTVPNPEEPLFLNITLRFNGNFINFGKYLSHLEKAPFFRGINYSKIVTDKDNPRNLLFTVNFKALLGRIGEDT